MQLISMLVESDRMIIVSKYFRAYCRSMKSLLTCALNSESVCSLIERSMISLLVLKGRLIDLRALH